MATRAEQFHAQEQRRGRGQTERAERSKPGSKPEARLRDKKHAGRKATHVLEEGASRSRKSTRKSANRAKPDAGLVLREELRKNTPTARYRKSSARPDGSPA